MSIPLEFCLPPDSNSNPESPHLLFNRSLFDCVFNLAATVDKRQGSLYLLYRP
jgi:hypothetical protein